MESSGPIVTSVPKKTCIYEKEENYIAFLNLRTVQLDGDPEMFGNDHEGKSSTFLDCDWGNIGDFDDFDYLFRYDWKLITNYSTHELILQSLTLS